ncbi:hypothetical protein ALC53_02366 [Atta colombica]|uniref:Uncharacterized protein n=1 Tax=Atta colombica TaxID=520822 RepID=A0A195BSL6_9HYME|nr:hypothetical protein ALC53_02366 [Atta colombica]
MHRTVGVRSALLTARSSAAVATVTTDRRPTRLVTFESRGFDDDNCCRSGCSKFFGKNCHCELRLNFALTSKGHKSRKVTQQNLPLDRDISRFIIVRYNVAIFLVFLLRKCQFVPSPLVTSILMYIFPLSTAGNNGAITAMGLVIVLTGFSARQPVLPRFSRKLHIQWLHALLVFSYVI